MQKADAASTALCQCGQTDARGQVLAYPACCGRFLDGQALAPDAQALMRSRYTAFVRGRADYLLATWHPTQRPATLEFEAGAQWLGLAVRRYRSTGPDQAEVEFVARYRLASGRAVRLHECSRFVREPVQGQMQWLYLDGAVRA
jgi:SEC-C motif-containing protein